MAVPRFVVGVDHVLERRRRALLGSQQVGPARLALARLTGQLADELGLGEPGERLGDLLVVGERVSPRGARAKLVDRLRAAEEQHRQQ